jgi:predicted GNAT family N-acyltransferase
MLMKSGLEIADRYKQKTHVISSQAGLKFYESVGFETVESTFTSYSQFGAIEPFVHHFMVRKSALRESEVNRRIPH